MNVSHLENVTSAPLAGGLFGNIYFRIIMTGLNIPVEAFALFLIYTIWKHSPDKMQSYKYFVMKMTSSDLIFSFVVGHLFQPVLLFPLPAAGAVGFIQYAGPVGGKIAYSLVLCAGLAILYSVNDCCIARFMIMYGRQDWLDMLKGKIGILYFIVMYGLSFGTIFAMVFTSTIEYPAMVRYAQRHNLKEYLRGTWPEMALIAYNIEGEYLIYETVFIIIWLFFTEFCNVFLSWAVQRKINQAKSSMSPETFKMQKALTIMLLFQCYPIAYIRLRQSCRFMDEFCEKNRNLLGIYCYKKDPHFHFGNVDLTYGYYVNNNIEIGTPYLSSNCGYLEEITDSIIHMTEENISRIKASLSGFTFTHLTVALCRPEKMKIFTEAFEMFLVLAADFHLKHVIFCDPVVAHVQLVLNVWKLESLALLHPFLGIPIWEYLTLDGMKKVPCLTYENNFNSEYGQDFFDYEKNIMEMAKGRRYLKIQETRLSLKVIWKALNWIYTDWKTIENVPEKLIFEYFFNENEDLNLFQDAALYLSNELVYIGEFPFGQEIVYNMWIIKLEDNVSWRTLLIKRDGSEGIMTFSVKRTLSQSQLAEVFVNFIGDSFAQRVPLDFSLLYNFLTSSKTIGEINFHIAAELSILNSLYSAET